MEDGSKRHGGEREGLGGFLWGFQIFREKDREEPIFERILSRTDGQKPPCRHVTERLQIFGIDLSITESSKGSEGTRWVHLGLTLGPRLMFQV